MKKQKKEKFQDDGRVIANMNVEGMPWYTEGGHKAGRDEVKPVPLTFREKLAMLKGVILAALFVAAVFGVVFTLFILFCVKIWFA